MAGLIGVASIFKLLLLFAERKLIPHNPTALKNIKLFYKHYMLRQQAERGRLTQVNFSFRDS